MATPSENLAASLLKLKELQDSGEIAVQSAHLSRIHKERLVKAGYLKEVIRGWYIPTRPDEKAGESTSWYTSYWHFCAQYLTERFDENWCLSPEQSVLLHVENRTVPAQLLVRAPGARNQKTELLHDTSVFEVRAALPDKSNLVTTQDGLRIFSLHAAIIHCSADFYLRNTTDARTALYMFRDASELLVYLLNGGHSSIAGRLAGAFRNIGRVKIADDILQSMRSAGYVVRENDPFAEQIPNIISHREVAPYANRIRLLWQAMRHQIIPVFPQAPGIPLNLSLYMKHVADVFVNDAYNSLSIEGYRVNADLIDRVRSGNWSSDNNDDDRSQRDAMAARGYWQAFQAVQQSVQKALEGKNAGAIADAEHQIWYRELFAPSVTAGILQPSDLAGYRSHPVFIRRSMHVPLHPEAVRDSMPVFFELLQSEENAAVRTVLGHFIFVYIHPYMDGNGRIARFLMNVMLASGGYPWTIIPLDQRERYMNALEQASVYREILPFATFLSELVQKSLNKIDGV